jgi:hypothetical protein
MDNTSENNYFDIASETRVAIVVETVIKIKKEIKNKSQDKKC